MDWGFTYRGIHSSEKGLRIANITGRDTLPDIESRTAQTASKHGVHYFGYRFQERRIRAEIALYGSSLSNFRNKIREIAAWLNPYDGPGELIFDDEPDKKYFAVITDNTDFEGMFIKRAAEIEFLCPDPFAYAISETAATITGNSLTIDNDGTAETFPVIEITTDGTVGPDNFEGKVRFSTEENPHKLVRGSLTANSLPTPSQATTEETQGAYDLIEVLDGFVRTTPTSSYGAYGHHVFSFNIIALIKRKFGFTVPGANLAEQVQWLKTNISSITANWWGKGTNKQANPTGKANFAGKVSGSTVESPHVSKAGSGTNLVSPSGFSTELAEASYDSIEALDGNLYTSSTTTSGRIYQQLFSFNLIEYVQRKYFVTVPGATTADKVQWLKDNVSKITFRWYGFGSGPSGNLANLKWWADSSGVYNTTPKTHSNGSVSILDFSFTDINNPLTASGFMHFLAYAEASNGTTASTINTDYVELEVELKAGENRSTISAWRSDANAWNTTVFSQTKDTISKLTHTSQSVSLYVNSDGFFYLIAYAEPSNGISPSTIETDYIELQVKLSKVEGIKVSNGDEFIAIQRSLVTGDKVKIDNERGTITLNGTTDIISSLDIDSDFFAIKSGSSTLTVGGGNGTVRYTKRWL